MEDEQANGFQVFLLSNIYDGVTVEVPFLVLFLNSFQAIIPKLKFCEHARVRSICFLQKLSSEIFRAT